MNNLIEIAEHHSRHYAERVAWKFLDDNGQHESSYTFRQLYHDFCRIGSTLRNMEMQGERVLILLPPSAEFQIVFLGIMFGQAIPVPSYFIDPKYLRRGLPRLKEIIRASQTSLIVTTPALAQVLTPFLSVLNIYKKATGHSASRALKVTTVKNLLKGNPEPIAGHDIDDNALALLQFTSGSTGNPKGVMITQKNIVSFAQSMMKEAQYDESYSGVSWLPPYHDFGLIGSLCLFFTAGHTSYYMSPLTFLKKPHLWLQTISNCPSPVISCSPPFALDFCVRKIKDAQLEGLDLSSWKRLILGAEPIRYDVLDRFAKRFAPYGFDRNALSPGYGMAETTLAVSGKFGWEFPRTLRVSTQLLNQGLIAPANESEPATDLVESGTPSPGHDFRIVDPETKDELPGHRIGEIWIHGPCIAQGYWNDREKTSEIFGNQIKSDPNERSYLRSGDLGFMHEGRIFITGRLKEIIIINGANYYPQDIESLVQSSNKAFRAGCGAAAPIVRQDQEGFILAQEVKADCEAGDFSEWAKELRQLLSENIGIVPWDIYFLSSGGLPKTSSGKVQRVDLQKRIMGRDVPVLYHCRNFADPGLNA